MIFFLGSAVIGLALLILQINADNVYSEEGPHLLFRNETRLQIFFLPKSLNFTHSVISINPPHSSKSILIIKNANNYLNKIEASFDDLLPGTFYTVSIQQLYGQRILTEKNESWATRPSAPLTVKIDNSSVTPKSFRINWSTENEVSGFDGFTIILRSDNINIYPDLIKRVSGHHKKSLEIYDLEAGKTYQIDLITMFNYYFSFPVKTQITLPPLPVNNLVADTSREVGSLHVNWEVSSPESIQDSYRIDYQIVGECIENEGMACSGNVITGEKSVVLSLSHGENYSISVKAVSKGVESDATVIHQLIPNSIDEEKEITTSTTTSEPNSPVESYKSLEESTNASANSDFESEFIGPTTESDSTENLEWNPTSSSPPTNTKM